MQMDEYTTVNNIIVSLAEQCSSGGMYKISETHNQKCLETNQDVSVGLLQVRSTTIGAGLLSPATLLINRPIKDLLPQKYREHINVNNDNAQYKALGAYHNKNIKNNDIHKDPSVFFCCIYSSSAVGRWRAMDT